MKNMLLMTAALCALSGWADVHSTQTISFSPGWTAVYAEVSPTGTLDSVFADWPTDSIGFYDPATLLSTAQFSSSGETQGLTMAPFATWRRGYPEASNASRLSAGTVLVFASTNKTSVVLVGEPAAPRLRWHVSGTNDVYNYVGFSLKSGVEISPSDYLDGFGGASIANRTFYKIFGPKTQAPRLVKISATSKVSDGAVLAMSSDIVSDWSGVLNVSPMNGLDFGTDGVKRTLAIRNDGTNGRTVRVALADDAANIQDITLPYTALYVRDPAEITATNASWTACTNAVMAEKFVPAGKTWELQVGLDRTVMRDEIYGRTFGLILRITDEDGGSMMRVDIPIQGATSGGTASARAWPGGLWVGDVALNMIKGPDDAAASETGGTLKLRLPIHVDANGKIRLLQRVVAAGDIGSDGYWDYRLYAGSATPPATAQNVFRVSAVCLPTEIPVVEAKESNLASGKAQFSFTVAGDGATSLLRHPYHPQHDGLRWDFKTAAPSGDDWQNYKYDVKPETFSVKCDIAVTLDFDGGEAAWNPDDEVNGTCTWSLEGLRHEGAIVVSGPMTIKRISPKPEIELE